MADTEFIYSEFCIPGSEFESGAIAQLGERLPCTQEVGSSILPGSTKLGELSMGVAVSVKSSGFVYES